MGTSVLCFEGRELFTIKARTPYERASVSLREKVWFENRILKVKQRDRSADILFAERLCRIILARCASRRLETTTNANVNGGSCRMMRHTLTNKSYVDLDDWQTARGFTETYDENRELSTMKRGNLTLQIPLASKQIKVYGNWHDLPDIVMQKDGRWYADLEALEQHQRP